MLRFVLVISTAVLGVAASATAGTAADPAAVARIHGGIVDCVACQLAGADLSNTCVKAHDLHGADFDGARAVMMCMSYANFSGATFRGTDLSGANLAHANLDGADVTGATMTITSIKGTDLTKVKGLTQTQLDAACGDTHTTVPAGLRVHACS